MGSAFAKMQEKLRGKYFLSSMMNVTTGSWCAEHGAGTAMVQLGAYIADRQTFCTNPAWLPLDREGITGALRSEVEDFRSGFTGEGLPLICANMYPGEDEFVTPSAEALKGAGADIYELNAHGGIEGWKEQGSGQALFHDAHTPKLYRWVEELIKVGIPVIVKARAHVIQDYASHVQTLSDMGAFAFHINVRDAKETGGQSLDILRQLRQSTDAFLLVSGYAKDRDSAQALFEAGADCVGIAAAAQHDRDIFKKLEG